MPKLTPEFLEQVQDRHRSNVNRLNEQAMKERAVALREPGAEVLLNGRCVGKLVLDEREATCLVMTWHYPDCEHITAELPGMPASVTDEQRTLTFVLDQLEQMTAADFQLGADRPARTAIVARLSHLGAATDEQTREYLS